MCQILGVSRSGYYRWLKEADKAKLGYQNLDQKIKHSFEHSRCIYGSPRIAQDLAKSGMIFHSDRGIQYACAGFRQLLALNKCAQSMSRKANCWDNTVAESFFKTIKTECIDKYEFTSQAQAYTVIFDYIDGWYNTKQIHSANGGLTPAEMFELLKLKKQLPRIC